MSEITLLVLADPAEPTMQLLKALGPDVRIKIANTADGFSPEIEDARVLFSWGGSKPEVLKVLATAPKLEWIHTRSAGLDGLLAPELIQSPVLLTNGSGSFSQSLGEFVMTGALYFAKDLPRMLRSKATHHWDVFDVAEISKQTMGIVGHGDIGRAIAWRTKAMGMRVLALRRDISPRAGDENVDRLYSNEQLHEMLPECDYVTVSAPLTAYTRHLLSTPEFNGRRDERGPRAGDPRSRARRSSQIGTHPRRCSRRLRGRTTARRQPAVGHGKRPHFGPHRRPHEGLARRRRKLLPGTIRPLGER
jgi:phosphoglycerate dehydrogenase-like enzyme